MALLQKEPQINEDHDLGEIGLEFNRKIDPNQMIFYSMFKVMNSLDDVGDPKFIRYRLAMGLFESNVRAAGYINKDYDDKIALFKLSPDYTQADDTVKEIRLAQYKYTILSKAAYDRQPKTLSLPL